MSDYDFIDPDLPRKKRMENINETLNTEEIVEELEDSSNDTEKVAGRNVGVLQQIKTTILGLFQ